VVPEEAIELLTEGDGMENFTRRFFLGLHNPKDGIICFDKPSIWEWLYHIWEWYKTI
jgi:hypothetical protein